MLGGHAGCQLLWLLIVFGCLGEIDGVPGLCWCDEVPQQLSEAVTDASRLIHSSWTFRAIHTSCQQVQLCIVCLDGHRQLAL